MKKQLFMALSFVILTGINYQACGMEKELQDLTQEQELSTYNNLNTKELSEYNKLNSSVSQKHFLKCKFYENKVFETVDNYRDQKSKILKKIEQTLKASEPLTKSFNEKNSSTRSTKLSIGKYVMEFNRINKSSAVGSIVWGSITLFSGYYLIKLIKSSQLFEQKTKSTLAGCGFSVGLWGTYKGISTLFKPDSKDIKN